jgi:intracellular sulfur oxidation DsrE/DsrF family protein
MRKHLMPCGLLAAALVEYTTAGVTAIADLQSLGYTYVQP